MLKTSSSSKNLGEHLTHFFISHQKGLFIFLIGLLVLGGGLWGFQGYSEHYSKKAWRALESRPWSEAGGVITDYPRSDAAVIARLALAKKALDEEKWDEAMVPYQALRDLPERQLLFRLAARQNLALAYRGKKEYDLALNELRAVEKDPANLTPDYTRLLESQLLREKGEVEEAKKLLETLSKEALQPEIRKEAEVTLAWMNEPKDSKKKTKQKKAGKAKKAGKSKKKS
ncbi:MAG: hypothetical protein HYY44_07085 [Deltaproteobacteria bacterium]|nr:hypothetical protein [Deltaproteobacteria bacterium]